MHVATFVADLFAGFRLRRQLFFDGFEFRRSPIYSFGYAGSVKQSRKCTQKAFKMWVTTDPPFVETFESVLLQGPKPRYKFNVLKQALNTSTRTQAVSTKEGCLSVTHTPQ